MFKASNRKIWYSSVVQSFWGLAPRFLVVLFWIIVFSCNVKQTESPQSSADRQPIKADWITAVLNQVVVFQVALQEVVLHRLEDKSNVVRVGGTGEVGVDDFSLNWIEAEKHV